MHPPPPGRHPWRPFSHAQVEGQALFHVEHYPSVVEGPTAGSEEGALGRHAGAARKPDRAGTHLPQHLEGRPGCHHHSSARHPEDGETAVGPPPPIPSRRLADDRPSAITYERGRAL